MERKAKSVMMLCVLLIGILTLSLSIGVLKPIQAGSLDLTDLELEKSEEWSSTVVNSVFCSDVDGDGDVEIVTGGTDLRIWHWDGATLTQETSTAIVVNSVFCSDVDGDGDVEIVTGGVDNLRVFRWDGATLTQEGGGITIKLDSVFCGDVDGDGDVEIVGGGVVGFFVWRWNGAALIMEASTATAATSLFCGDVDGDGDVEIVGSAGSWLRVWRWDGTTLTLEASGGGSSGPYMYSVFAHDVDADGNVEIVTGGYFLQQPPFPPFQYYCELRVWNSSGTALTLETYKRWGSPLHSSSDDACVRSVYCGNVDDDDDVEIVTGGCLDGEGPLRSWSIKQGSIVLENYANWNAIVYSVFCGDVDGDGRTEIVTGGEAAYNAQLRIWSVLPRSPLFPLVLEASGCGYEIDSTCCDDVDGDGDREIVTGGYYRESGAPYHYHCQLQIWNWDGTTLTQEAYEDWDLGGGAASVRSVCVGDVDDDGAEEIMTVASFSDGIRFRSQLRIWNWNGITLTLEKNEEWYTTDHTHVYSVVVDDVDGDGDREIITGGYAYDGARYNGQLRIWSWDGTTLTLEKSQEWYVVGSTHVYSVCVGDVDGDGAEEIVTGGDAAYQGHLRVWNWNGATLTLEVSQEWRILSNTCVYSVCVGDVDGDGAEEIVTGGDANDGTNYNGQIRVWRWDGTTLALEVFRDWASEGPTEVRSVCSRDVYGDSEVEIVSGGAASNATDTNGQIRVWRWDGVTLNLEVSKIVYTPSQYYSIHIYSVCTDDVNGDGMVEIVTGGSDYGFAKLRIWHVVSLIGDIDGDGDVDRYDFGIFAGAYASTTGDPNYDIRCDFDGDGDVDRYDFGTFSGNYGKTI